MGLVSIRQRRMNLRRSEAAFSLSGRDVATNGPSYSDRPSRPLGGGLSDGGFRPNERALVIDNRMAGCGADA
jgi:hypothetical protein